MSVPTLIISTSVSSPTAPLSATPPSQAPLCPVQPWCIGQIICPWRGTPDRQLYSDPKTFVDKPTGESAQQVLADLAMFNVTEGDLINFVENV